MSAMRESRITKTPRPALTPQTSSINPSEQTMQDAVAVVRFIHLTDIVKQGFSFRAAWFHHDESNSASVCPMTSFSQEDSSEFVLGDAVQCVRHIHNYGEALGCVPFRSKRPGEQAADRKGEDSYCNSNPHQHEICYSPHRCGLRT